VHNEDIYALSNIMCWLSFFHSWGLNVSAHRVIYFQRQRLKPV